MPEASSFDQLTTERVHGASLGGHGAYAVSFFNGAAEAVPTPIPVERPPVPQRSRLRAHALASGAAVVDADVQERREHIVAAAVSRAGACVARLAALPPAHPFSAASAGLPSAAAAATPTTTVGVPSLAFFVGGQRVGHVPFPREALADAPDAFSSGGGESVAAWDRRVQRAAALPLLCLTLPTAPPRHVGVCCASPGVLLAVSHAGTLEETTRLASPACCLAEGRPGAAAECVLVLEGHALALRRAVARGPAGVALQPVYDAVLPLPTGAAVTRVAWGGRRLLWTLQEDGALCALWLPATPRPATAEGGGASNRNSGSDASDAAAAPALVFSTKLPPGAQTDSVLLAGEPTAPAVHYAFREEGDASGKLHYGTIRLGHPPAAAGAAPTVVPSHCRHYCGRVSATLFGLAADAGGYRVLSQAGRQLRFQRLPTTAAGPGACLAAVNPLVDGGCAAPTVPAGLAIAAAATAEELGAHCRACQRELEELRAAAVRSEAAARDVLGRLRALHTRVYALLRREEGRRVADGNSLPRRLMASLGALYTRVTAQDFLNRLGLADAAAAPLAQALSLAANRQRAAAAHAAVRGVLVGQLGGALEAAGGIGLAGLQLFPAAAPPLCAEVLLQRLGGLAAEGCTLADVIDRCCCCPGGSSNSGNNDDSGTGGVAASPYTAEGSAAAAAATTTTTAMPVALALLILYLSFVPPTATTATSATAAAGNTSTRQVSSAEAARLRQAFLDYYRYPASLLTWAYLASAVDHGVNPEAPFEDGPGSNNDNNNTGGGGQEEAPAAGASESESHSGLGAATSPAALMSLASPPLGPLLPAAISGLARVGALETVLHLANTALGGAADALPPDVLPTLLLVALRLRSPRLLALLYSRARGPAARAVAAHALAVACVLEGSAAPLQALLHANSEAERVAERAIERAKALGGGEEEAAAVAAGRLPVLLGLYLMAGRYADALATARRMHAEAADEEEAQRTAALVSQLRSLMPAGDETFMAGGAAAATTDPHLYYTAEREERRRVCCPVPSPAVAAADLRPLPGLHMCPASLREEGLRLAAQRRTQQHGLPRPGARGGYRQAPAGVFSASSPSPPGGWGLREAGAAAAAAAGASSVSPPPSTSSFSPAAQPGYGYGAYGGVSLDAIRGGNSAATSNNNNNNNNSGLQFGSGDAQRQQQQQQQRSAPKVSHVLPIHVGDDEEEEEEYE